MKTLDCVNQRSIGRLCWREGLDFPFYIIHNKHRDEELKPLKPILAEKQQKQTNKTANKRKIPPPS